MRSASLACTTALLLSLAPAFETHAQTVAAAPATTLPAWPTIYPTAEHSVLARSIEGLLADPRVRRAHWGVAVTALDGTPLLGIHEAELFHPASVTKLFTTSAATAMLGADRRFRTTLLMRGNIADGTLHGDLILQGGGDANFAGSYTLPYRAPAPHATTPLATQPDASTLPDLDAFATQVAGHGITRIDGDILGDDRAFEDTPYGEGWSVDDVLWGYGAPASALTVHDNQLELTVTDAGEPRTPHLDTITLTPAVPFYTVNQESANAPMPLGVWSGGYGQNRILIERDPGSRDFRVVGNVAAEHGPARQKVAIDQPAAFAAAAMQQALEQHGVSVSGRAHAVHWDSGFTGSLLAASRTPLPAADAMHLFQAGSEAHCELSEAQAVPGTTQLTEKLSPPLSEDVVLTLKDSVNLHAELMLRNLAAAKSCERTLRSGLQLERAYLTHAGLDPEDFVFYDGSGLSDKDLVTPRATAQLLAYNAQQSWFPGWKSALPIGGVDGTLFSRFTQAPLRGHVYAKTGTLGEANALAGYVDTHSGRSVIFVLMVDNHMPGSHAEREIMDRIVAAISASL
ncbi:MAG: D-alanyl-D-alanine carboxypeptidase/D-alanyl-D-alanine-endopeptidase [Acidobacteriaceae bacterium]|nr:D-alanyl-D-alanine carboxypeptidase/D-alanyl-D-alanine-endopeptidase [Acidobacteriaceae bacterium]